MENTSENTLIINPTNSIPKGFSAFWLWLTLGISIVTLPFGGIFFVWIPVLFLFVIPHKYKKNMPISCLLDDKKICTYNLKTGKEVWSIPWEDIESIYFVSTHWAVPKNIGLRLNNYDNFRASIERNSLPTPLAQAFAKFSTNKVGMLLARMIVKCDAIILHHALDRSPKAFSELLFSYMYKRQLEIEILNSAPSSSGR
jgi:hypothetical protein